MCLSGLISWGQILLKFSTDRQVCKLHTWSTFLLRDRIKLNLCQQLCSFQPISSILGGHKFQMRTFAKAQMEDFKSIYNNYPGQKHTDLQIVYYIPHSNTKVTYW